MPRKKSATSPAQRQEQSTALADYTAKLLDAAEILRMKRKSVESFPLEAAERVIVADLPALDPKIKTKLANMNTRFTVVETLCILNAVADAFVAADPLRHLALLCIAQELIDCLQENIAQSYRATTPTNATLIGALFQFKITLIGSKPPIWRRIQVQDCTLDKLHEYIQTAMGWTNSHLHHFRVGKQLYGDPMLIGENMGEMNYKDSTRTKISKILPNGKQQFSFIYEYDFGDCWEHEVLFEGSPKAEPGKKYPLCLDGERACPPDDCGGVWGYGDFLKAIGDKNHEEHQEMLEWIGGRFDPEEFDPAVATKSMKKGLPNWRND